MKRTDGFTFIALCTSVCMFSCTSDVDIKTIWKCFQDKEKVSSEDRVALNIIDYIFTSLSSDLISQIEILFNLYQLC